MSGAVNVVFRVANVLTLGLSGKLLDALMPSPTDQVQTLGDISRQTAKEGDPRPIVWGRVRPIGGNIIHCQAPVKRWVVTSTSSGGKGGSKKKQEQRTEHVYRTYAIGVCEGPITGFSRIWRNNKLVYDGRGTTWGAANNPIFLRTFRLYLGGWAQMPDPTLQSIWGSGNVPAYRGTAYMVSIDEDLTDQGGMVPQWQFEVERAEGIFYTSKPYAVEDEQLVFTSGNAKRGKYEPVIYDELVIYTGSPLDGELRILYKEYVITDENISTSGGPLDGSIGSLVSTYSYAEGVQVSALPITATLEVRLIRYQFWSVEQLQTTALPLNGILS